MKKDIFSQSNLTPLFDRIEKLTKLQRILISVGVLALLIGAFVYFAYLPKFKQIDKYKKEQSKLNTQLQEAKKKASELKNYQAQMKKAEAEFKVAMRKLPEKKEIPSLLANVSQSGQDVGLEFLLFKPSAEVKREFYAEIPVQLKVTGDYHTNAMFFDKVSKLSRIVNLKNITMVPHKGAGKAGQTTLETSCTAVTYKFIEASPKKKTKQKKSKRRKRKGKK